MRANVLPSDIDPSRPRISVASLAPIPDHRQGRRHLTGAAGADTYVFAGPRPGRQGRCRDRHGRSRGDPPCFRSGRRLAAVQGQRHTVLPFASGTRNAISLRGALAADGSGIEQIHFADGVVWNREAMARLLDNNAPVAAEDGVYSFKQDAELTIEASDLLRNDFDADGEPLKIVAVDRERQCHRRRRERQRAGQRDDRISPGRRPHLHGVRRPQRLRETTVDIRVAPVAAAKDDRLHGRRGRLPHIRAERLLSNDLDGDRMIVGQVFGAEQRHRRLSSDGNIAFTPTANFNGPARSPMSPTRPKAAAPRQEVYIDVTPVNDAPVAQRRRLRHRRRRARSRSIRRPCSPTTRDIDGDHAPRCFGDLLGQTCRSS